jgi:hypothetical protein
MPDQELIPLAAHLREGDAPILGFVDLPIADGRVARGLARNERMQPALPLGEPTVEYSAKFLYMSATDGEGTHDECQIMPLC